MKATSGIGRVRVLALCSAGVALALLAGLMPATADDVSYEDPASRAVKVVAGTAHTCLLTDEGAVRCWGYNQDGEAGIGSADYIESPTEVAF